MAEISVYTLYSSIIVPVHQRREEVTFGSVEAESYVGVDGHAGLHTAQACGVHFTHSDLAPVDTGRQKSGVWLLGASEIFSMLCFLPRGVCRHQRPGTCIAGTWLERDAGLCAIRAASQVTERAPRNNCGKILGTIRSQHLLRPQPGRTSLIVPSGMNLRVVLRSTR